MKYADILWYGNTSGNLSLGNDPKYWIIKNKKSYTHTEEPEWPTVKILYDNSSFHKLVSRY